MDLRNRKRFYEVQNDCQAGDIKRYQRVNVVHQPIAQLVCPLRVVLKPVTMPTVGSNKRTCVPSNSSDTSVSPTQKSVDACDEAAKQPSVLAEKPTSLVEKNGNNSSERNWESSGIFTDSIRGGGDGTELNMTCARDSERTFKNDGAAESISDTCERSTMATQTDVANQSIGESRFYTALAGSQSTAAAEPELVFLDSLEFDNRVVLGTGWRLFVGQRSSTQSSVGPTALRVDMHMMRYAATQQVALVGELDCRCTVQWTELDGCSVLPRAGDELRELQTNGLLYITRPWSNSNQPLPQSALFEGYEKCLRHFRLSYALVSAVKPDEHALWRLGNALAHSRSVLVAALGAARIALLFPSSPYAHRRGFLPATHSRPVVYLHCILVEGRESSEQDAQCLVRVPGCVLNVAARVQRGFVGSTVHKRVAFQRAFRQQRAMAVKYPPKFPVTHECDSDVTAKMPACYLDLASLMLQSQCRLQPTRLPPWNTEQHSDAVDLQLDGPSSPLPGSGEEQPEVLLQQVDVPLSPPKNNSSVPLHTVQQRRLACKAETARLVQLLLRQSKFYEAELKSDYSDSSLLDQLDWNLQICADDSGTTIPFGRLSPAAALLWLRTPPHQRAGFKLRPAPTIRPPVQSPSRAATLLTASTAKADVPFCLSQSQSQSPNKGSRLSANATADYLKLSSKSTGLSSRRAVSLVPPVVPRRISPIQRKQYQIGDIISNSHQNSVTILCVPPRPKTAAQNSSNWRLHTPSAALSHPIASPIRGRGGPSKLSVTAVSRIDKSRIINVLSSSPGSPTCSPIQRIRPTCKQSPNFHLNVRSIAADSRSAISEISTNQSNLRTVNVVQAQLEQPNIVRSSVTEQSTGIALTSPERHALTGNALTNSSNRPLSKFAAACAPNQPTFTLVGDNGKKLDASTSPLVVMPDSRTTPQSRCLAGNTLAGFNKERVTANHDLTPMTMTMTMTNTTGVSLTALEYIVKHCGIIGEPITNERIVELLNTFFNLSLSVITQSSVSITNKMQQLGYCYQCSTNSWLLQPKPIPVQQTGGSTECPVVDSSAPIEQNVTLPAVDPLGLCATIPDPKLASHQSANAASKSASAAADFQAPNEVAPATESTSESFSTQKRSIASNLRIKTINRLMKSLHELNVPITTSRVSDEIRDTSYAISEADLLEAMGVDWYMDDSTATWLPKR